MQVVLRVAPVAFLCTLLGACAGTGDTEIAATQMPFPPARHYTPTQAEQVAADDPTLFPDDSDDDTGPSQVDGPRMQCVPYAREHSSVNIHGNANTWWAQAEGQYYRGTEPVQGAVMVLTGYGRNRGHVAVVRRVVTNREIRIDHANWLDHGVIYVNDPVIDVSENNDWSQVKVWNIQTGSWGTRIYQVQGFIGPGRAGDDTEVSMNASDPIARQIALASRDDSGDDADNDDDR